MTLISIPLSCVHAIASSSISLPSSTPASDPPSPTTTTLLSTPRSSIYSLSFSPSSPRFATGGGDSRVKIWSITNDLFKPPKMSDVSGTVRDDGGYSSIDAPLPPPPTAGTAAATPSSPPFLLWTGTSHAGSVLSVRWSSSGRYLASASDDTTVCIYHLTRSPPTSSYSFSSTPNTVVNVENWERCRVLRRHELDVVDICWSPDDEYLVSCSLDSQTPICVWLIDLPSCGSNATSTTTSNPVITMPKHILGTKSSYAHTSTVKGVSFDPMGKFLTSFGDDPALVVWSVPATPSGAFKKELAIDASNSEVFNSAQGGGLSDASSSLASLASLAMFRRVSWAPDGMTLALPGTYLKSKPIGSIVSRNTWKCGGEGGGANLVGHKKTVVVACYNQRMFENGGGEGARMVVAIGDKKGFVSVWSSTSPKPVFKIQVSDQHQTVTDLSWSRCGYILMVSTLDGFVTVVKFEEDELGRALTKEEADGILLKRYGSAAPIPGAKSNSGLVESVLQLGMEKQHELSRAANQFARPTNEGVARNLAVANKTPADTLMQQKVGMKKGRKKITPVLVKTSGEVGVDPSTFNVGGGENVVENGQTSAKAPTIAAAAQPASKPSSKPATPTKASKPATPTKASKPASKPTSKPATPTNCPNPSDLKPATPNAVAETVRRQAAKATEEQQKKKRKTTSKASTPTKGDEASSSAASLLPSSSKPAAPLIAVKTPGTLRIELKGGAPLDAMLDSDEPAPPLVATAINENGSVRVTMTQGPATIYTDVVPASTASAICASESFFAVGTSAGAIHVWRGDAGRAFERTAIRAAPTIAVGGGGVGGLQLYQDGGSVRLMCLCGDGDLVVWNLIKREQVIKISIAPAVHTMHGSAASPSSPLPTLARSFLEQDTVMILLQQAQNGGGNMQGFAYDKGMSTWLRIADSRYATSDFYSDSTLRARMGGTPSALSKMDAFAGKGSAMAAASIFAGAADGSAAAKARRHVMNRGHVEDKLACAVALGSAGDYQYWLGEMCKFLAAAGDEQAFRQIIDELLAGDFGGAGDREEAFWFVSDAASLGLDKMELLREVVLVSLVTNRALQPLVGELQARMELAGELNK